MKNNKILHKRTTVGVFSLLLTLLFSCQADAQTTRRVPADFPTIQIAINTAVDGDTVLVAPGTYQESIRFLGKSIHVVSEDGPATTTINGQSGSVVLMIDGEGPDAILEGFTIQGGTGTPLQSGDTIGGGVFVFDGGNPTIRGNIITQNSVNATLGGGIAALEAAATIEGNTITMNSGGGVYMTLGTQPTILRNNIVNANPVAEGIRLVGPAMGIVEDNTVFDNGRDGIEISGAAFVSVARNTVSNNGLENSSGSDNGIRVQTGDVVHVNDNLCFDHPGDGITVRSSEVIFVNDNVCRDNGDEGMYIWIIDISADVARNVTNGNASNGIHCRNVASLTCINQLTAENGEDGILLRDCQAATVDGLTSFRNAGDGVSVGSNDNFTQFRNSIVRGNGSQFDQFLGGVVPTFDFCNFEGGMPGTGNIDVDPMFVNSMGPDGDATTVDDNDYRLQAGSPCIDAGDSTDWLCTDFDLARNPRLTDGTLDGVESVDMGALEYNNVYLTIVGEPTADGLVTVEVSGAAGMSVEILVGATAAASCSDQGPLYLDETTAVAFGPLTSPGTLQIQLPAGVSQHIIQAVAVTANDTTIGNTSNPVSIDFEVENFDLGDVNRDGFVNLLDVAPFVDLLGSGDYQFEADINGDGVVNLLDVGGFVDLLGG